MTDEGKRGEEKKRGEDELTRSDVDACQCAVGFFPAEDSRNDAAVPRLTQGYANFVTSDEC